MKRLIGQLLLVTAVLAMPAYAEEVPTQKVSISPKTVQWLITPPEVVPTSFAEQTKVVAEWGAAARKTTTAYGVDFLLKQSAEAK